MYRRRSTNTTRPATAASSLYFVCALSLAGSIYLIVDMDQPYSGFIKLSNAPVLTALDQIGRP